MKRIIRRINIISRCSGIFRREKTGLSDLCPNQYDYVGAICNHPGISQDELASLLSVNKSSVARTLAQMEEKGYVTRRPCQKDRRQTEVFPTETMMQIFPAVREANVEWNDYLTKEIPRQDLEIFEKVLDQVVARAQAYMEHKNGAE